MMFWSDHDMSGWGYAGMVIGMVLFWALIIVGIIALIRYTASAPKAGPSCVYRAYPTTRSPEQMLAARFARGRSTRPDTATARRFCGPPRQ